MHIWHNTPVADHMLQLRMLNRPQGRMSYVMGRTAMASHYCLAFFAQQDVVITDKPPSCLLRASTHDTACMV